MTLLDRVHQPHDLRLLSREELPQLADELRAEIVRAVSETGGHFSSNLGSVELTIALHYLFDTPNDLLVWDVGHQTYPHKILTGRRDRMKSLRQYGGLSGFCLRSESEYDVVAAGHASTSISAALGLAVARDLKKEKHHVVAIIGDGSMTAGMAFEAMNQAGHLGTRMIVVLNDNSMSISPSVGALTKYLEALMAGRHYAKLKDDIKNVLHKIPGIGDPMLEVAKGLEEGVRQMFTPGTLFEELGFRYVGPVNGHSVPSLLDAFEKAKEIDGPVLVHAITQKGKGYKYAEDEPVEYHGPSPFDPVAGIQKARPAGAASAPSYTSVFGKTIVKLAERDPRIVAITASMPDGTGLNGFAERFPERFLNTGIAEQHSVTLAGGLALGGLKPVVAIYSTFLQRGFDQIFHDVCLMDLPVIFAMDRGGIAGNDGWTHHGLFDYAYFRIFPNTIIMAPKDENELQNMLATCLEQPHPTALRYPRGNGVGVAMDETPRALPVGRAEVLRRGRHGSVWAIGSTVYPALEAAERVAREGIDLTVVNARFVKPLDRELLRLEAERLGDGGRIVTVEEHVVAGGFGSAVLEAFAEMEMSGIYVLPIGVPDRFVPHGSQDVLRKSLGLDAESLAFKFRGLFSASRSARSAEPAAGGENGSKTAASGGSAATRPAAG